MKSFVLSSEKKMVFEVLIQVAHNWVCEKKVNLAYILCENDDHLEFRFFGKVLECSADALKKIFIKKVPNQNSLISSINMVSRHFTQSNILIIIVGFEDALNSQTSFNWLQHLKKIKLSSKHKFIISFPFSQSNITLNSPQYTTFNIVDENQSYFVNFSEENCFQISKLRLMYSSKGVHDRLLEKFTDFKEDNDLIRELKEITSQFNSTSAVSEVDIKNM